MDQTRSVSGLMECRWTREPFEPREQYGNNLERKPSQMIPNDPQIGTALTSFVSIAPADSKPLKFMGRALSM